MQFLDLAGVKKFKDYNDSKYAAKTDLENFYFVEGSSSQAGNSTSGSYLSTKWEGTISGVSSATNGLKIAYRIATNTGVSTAGVVLSIDGTNYYPVVIQKNTMVTTHYPVGATVLMVFNSTQTASAYLTANTKTTVTGCWQIMEYNSDTNTYQREYVSSGNVEYPITTRYNTTTGETYYAEYGRYSEGVTLNPSTNTITASKFKVTGGTSSQFLKADGTTDSNTYALASSIPDVSNMVSTTDTLTSNKIILGNGNKTVKVATEEILPDGVTPWNAEAETYIPRYSHITAATGTFADAKSNTLTANTIILGDGNKDVKSSSKTIATTLGSDDTTVPTSKAVRDAIPTVNNATLTIQKNGTTVNTFTANASSNVTVDIAVPTKTSDLTNDSGFLGEDEERAISEALNNLNDQLDSKAPLASPALTGTPTAPTAASGTNTTQVATTAFVQSALSSVSVNLSVSKTWSELKAMRDGGTLSPGTLYRIIDYVATTIDTESQSANHPFDVIIKAIDTNKLNEEGWAALHSGDNYFSSCNLSAWKVWYSIDNDTTRFAWADSTNGKGVIYRLIDEHGNDIPYDFKGIQFKRYKVTPKTGYETILADLSGMYLGSVNSSQLSGLNIDSSDYHWYYTFNLLSTDWVTPADASISGNVKSTIIKEYNDSYRVLNNNVFSYGSVVYSFLSGKGTTQAISGEIVCGSMYIGPKSKELTIIGPSSHLNMQVTFRNNIIVGPFRHNDFATNFQNNIIYAYSDFSFNGGSGATLGDNIIVASVISGNKFGYYFHGNTVSDCTNFYYNTISAMFQNNTIVGNFSSNDISASASNNSFAQTTGCKIIGRQLRYNQFLSQLGHCTITSIVEYVTIPVVSGKQFAYCDIKSIRGSSSAVITLDNDQFYLSSLAGVNRRITIEGDTNGKIIATWKSSGQIVGVTKSIGDNSWTNVSIGGGSGGIITIRTW